MLNFLKRKPKPPELPKVDPQPDWSGLWDRAQNGKFYIQGADPRLVTVKKGRRK